MEKKNCSTKTGNVNFYLGENWFVNLFEYMWGIPAKIDLAVTDTIFIFFHVVCCRTSEKNTVHEVLDFLKNFSRSISPKIIKKIENDWNFGRKLYVRKQIFWAMDESGRDFGLEVMRKSRVKKTEKQKLFNMVVPNFLYSKS